MDHVEDLNLLCLLLLDIFPNLKIIGAEYFDTKLLEGTQYEHLLEVSIGWAYNSLLYFLSTQGSIQVPVLVIAVIRIRTA